MATHRDNVLPAQLRVSRQRRREGEGARLPQPQPSELGGWVSHQMGGQGRESSAMSRLAFTPRHASQSPGHNACQGWHNAARPQSRLSAHALLPGSDEMGKQAVMPEAH